MVKSKILYSRRIIGWAYDTSMTAELAVKAVRNACMNVSDTKGIIIKSGLGTQYTSELFERYFTNHKIRHSVEKVVLTIMLVLNQFILC